MELIESYLVAMQQHLPELQRADIVRELRATLEEEVYDLAAEQNRDPTGDDELAVLAKLGHPMKVAGGYREQRYLIGPDLFPTYLHVLKMVVVIAFIGQLLVGFAAAFVAQWEVSLFSAFASMIELLVWVTIVVTLVFVSLEYSGEKLNWYDAWDPTSLNRDAAGVVNRSDVITNFITEGVFLLWWNDVLVAQNWLPIFGEGFPLTLSMAWDTLYWPLNIIFGVAFALHAHTLLRGLWYRFGLMLEAAINFALLAIVFVLLYSGTLIDVDLAMDGAVKAIQWSMSVTLLVIAGFIAWDAWLALRQLRSMRSLD